MAEEVKSNFTTEVVEPSELEKHIERLQKHTIPMKPEMLNLIQTLMNQHLQSGNVKAEELDALVFARDEINKATIDYRSHLERGQKRTQELQAEQNELNRLAREEAQAEQRQKLTDERVARKTADRKVTELEAEIERLKSEIKNVHEPKERTRAMEMARAMNPKPTEQEQFEEKVSATKKSFKEWEEENGHPTNDDIAELVQEELELDIPDDALTTEDFYKEVDKVSKATVEDLFDGVHHLKPDFEDSKPVVSNSQLPDIKTYDSEEELQAAIDEKNAFEEIVIPSESELQKMTKAQIHETAQELGFDKVNPGNTKAVMIEVFVSQTNDYIESLKEAGEFVSAETTDSSESSPTEDDRQDGGFF